MERRVTLRDIAEKAGVHLSTVSLALRNHPRISEKTRVRIQNLARELEYVPDASMSALASYRNSIRPHEVRTGLAYLSDWTSAKPFGAMVYDRARERAEERGYNLIEFNVGDGNSSLKHLQSIWWNTGLKGVLIGPFVESTSLDADWSRWPVVAYGYSVVRPSFNRVTVNHFQDMKLHLEVLAEKGYERIGLCLPMSLEARTGGQLRAAYMLFQDGRDGEAIPILDGAGCDDPDLLNEWAREASLDAVIGYREHFDSLVDFGWQIPDQLGFSLLTKRSYEQETESISGFDTKADLLARHSVDFLISLVHEQAYGVLDSPRVYMVSGEYRSAQTTRS
tara:strand:- start:8358 stop:9365 length:1008 start_codon:yes stop_codon:yes gene_type:complete